MSSTQVMENHCLTSGYGLHISTDQNPQNKLWDTELLVKSLSEISSALLYMSYSSFVYALAGTVSVLTKWFLK